MCPPGGQHLECGGFAQCPPLPPAHWGTGRLGGSSFTSAASPLVSGEDGGEEGASQSSGEDFVLRKQKSRPTAGPGLRGRGCAPPSPSLRLLATALVPAWPLPSSLFAGATWKIEFLNAFIFFFLSFFLNPELERQEKPVLEAAAAILPCERETWHWRLAGARGVMPCWGLAGPCRGVQSCGSPGTWRALTSLLLWF